MRKTLLLLTMPLFLLSACASYELMNLPAHDAGLYPFADIKGGVAAAIDDLSGAKRAKKYFGKDLRKHGIHPIEVIVSNHGRRRISVGPADVLLLRGRQVIDRVPLEKVSELVRDRSLIVTRRTAKHVDTYLTDLAFQESILAPGETYQGVVFFDAIEEPGLVTRFFRVFSPYPQPILKLQLAVTDLESRKRVRLGPFGVYR